MRVRLALTGMVYERIGQMFKQRINHKLQFLIVRTRKYLNPLSNITYPHRRKPKIAGILIRKISMFHITLFRQSISLVIYL